jgi:hypothetical protein
MSRMALVLHMLDVDAKQLGVPPEVDTTRACMSSARSIDSSRSPYIIWLIDDRDGNHQAYFG